MIKLTQLAKEYRAKKDVPVPVFSGLDLRIEAGIFAAVRGASGCGKSTLLLIAGGLMHPDTGRVEMVGSDLTAMRPDERARFRAAHIGYVFQRFHLLPFLSVLENVLAATIGLPGDPGISEERANELLEQFGLSHRVAHLPGELSVGEMQRTALARALLNKPKVILADEPTGNLDPENADRVLRAFSEFAEAGGAVLMATHNPVDAERAAAQWEFTKDGVLQSVPIKG